ncbi:sensor histidine kinase [Pedobacter sp. BAL39]|nr:sensor histidine kinase [Pedobacter sp. BAL39]
MVVENIAYDKAFEFRENGRIDSAFFYFNKAKDIFLRGGDSLGTGKCLLNMAIISTDKGDYFGGQELSLNAQKFFNEKVKNQYVFVRSNYNNLGIATYKLRDFNNSLRFYDAAIQFSSDSLDTRVCMNNKAKVYQEMKDYPKAISIYEHVLSHVSKNPREYARALSNIARAKWQWHSSYVAEKEFLHALSIRMKEKDLWGLNASYAHLSDYYVDRSPELALSYANKMYMVAQDIKSTEDQLTALQKLIKLSPGGSSKQYFKVYELLQDSITSVQNADKNQFALIRYESEKNEADKLLLQKDNQAKRYQIVLLGFGILLTLVIATLLYRNRKQKLTLEAKNAIRDSQLRTSKKVHDVVANGLYRVMTEIENQHGLNREVVLDKIEHLYEKSRDISYEDPLASEQPFNQLISELLGSFANDNTKVLIAGNSNELWSKVTEGTRYELVQIIQELMINMKKHSGAEKVLLRFERDGNHIKIYYSDNGKGMKNDTIFNNGLRNTGNRIETINGAITFDTAVERGLNVEISFPVS